MTTLVQCLRTQSNHIRYLKFRLHIFRFFVSRDQLKFVRIGRLESIREVVLRYPATVAASLFFSPFVRRSMVPGGVFFAYSLVRAFFSQRREDRGILRE